MPKSRTPRESLLEPAAFERLRRLGGERLVERMIATFLDYAPRQVDILRRGVEEQDRQAVVDAAHSLRSAAGNVGGMVLYERALAVERSAADGDEQALAADVRDLEHAFRDVCRELSRAGGEGSR